VSSVLWIHTDVKDLVLCMSVMTLLQFAPLRHTSFTQMSSRKARQQPNSRTKASSKLSPSVEEQPRITGFSNNVSPLSAIPVAAAAVWLPRWMLLAAVLVGITVACVFPRYNAEQDAAMLERFEHLIRPPPSEIHSPELRFPVMSFNIRYSLPGMNESNNANSWPHRLPRVVNVIRVVQPWIIGLQECMPGQLQDILSELHGYAAVRYTRKKDPPMYDQRLDTSVAILYDMDRLELLETDYLWLSPNPKEEDSSAAIWGGGETAQKVNIARFRINSSTMRTPADSFGEREIIHFNTHLTVRSELARRHQSVLLASWVREWKAAHPDAIIFVTGDFNTAPGQKAHQTLTEDGLTMDSWIHCSTTKNCVAGTLAPSFHGWLGSRLLNSYAARAFQGVAYTLHAWGFPVLCRTCLWCCGPC
jgi:endonuclease/exonuclease/phosphatase family metal-dependent hydrolase